MHPDNLNNMNPSLGKILMFVGVVITAIGLIVYFFGDYLRWVGRLPGDIHIEKENFSFYFPIVTMIVLSIVVTLLIRIFKMLF